MEHAVQMNPNSTLILGDEVNASMTASDYAKAYIVCYEWLKDRSPLTRLSTAGFEDNHDPFGFAEDFIKIVRGSVTVDEFRFNASFASNGALTNFKSYLGDAQAFAKGHGYLYNYIIGSFYAGPGLTGAQLRDVMVAIRDEGTVKEAVYYGFEQFNAQTDNWLATFDGIQVPELTDLGKVFARTIREFAD